MIWYYRNFTLEEMRCRHTGIDGMQPEFMEMLQKCRQIYGRPMTVTSAYRHPTHPIEARKARPGEHAMGLAADIHVTGSDALDLIDAALSAGFRRIGVNQNGDIRQRFIHLGASKDLPPGVWSY
jgi:zinc D-Ala-D-Ala carboxypeptidase